MQKVVLDVIQAAWSRETRGGSRGGYRDALAGSMRMQRVAMVTVSWSGKHTTGQCRVTGIDRCGTIWLEHGLRDLMLLHIHLLLLLLLLLHGSVAKCILRDKCLRVVHLMEVSNMRMLRSRREHETGALLLMVMHLHHHLLLLLLRLLLHHAIHYRLLLRLIILKTAMLSIVITHIQTSNTSAGW